jgi:hypothetical protein
MTPTPDDVLREFCAEVAAKRYVWALHRDAQVAIFSSREGERVLPVWSTEARCEEFISTHPAAAGLQPLSVRWDLFRYVWLNTMVPAGGELGIDWPGQGESCWATTQEVMAGVEAAG